MIRGFYTSLSGIVAAMDRQSVVAENIANVSTTGFRQSRTSFADIGMELGSSLGGSLGYLGTGAVLGAVSIDRTQGPIQETGLQTDLALEGDGLFTVQTPDGVAYTRAGTFIQAADGTLTTEQGYPVLDTAGQPIVTAGPPVIAPDGSVAGTTQRLGIIAWPDVQPVRLGQSLLAVEGPVVPAAGTVRQGALEGSNVDMSAAMTELVALQRHFAFSSRALSLEDQTVGDAVQIGRLK